MAYLEMRGITKRFGSVVANDHVDLSVERGEIHALLGENGAGKSTLMNVLYGMYDYFDGEVLLDGRPLHIKSPRDAIAHGIGMVHQHFMLIPAHTVVENIILGLPGDPILGIRQAAEEIRALAESLHIDIDPYALVSELTVGQQQRVEILKALYRKVKLLILDEPTAVLTPQESESLFEMIRSLAQQGMTVIFISHKLMEIMEISDRCTILRQGKVVRTVPISEISDRYELAALMIDKELARSLEKSPAKCGQTVLEVEGLNYVDAHKVQRLHDVSFSVRSGEILGVCGVDGNGQSELVRCITGLLPASSGSVRIDGEDCTNEPPRALLKKGFAHIPEDRHKMAVLKDMTVSENLMLLNYRDSDHSSHGILRWKKIDRINEELCRRYQIKTPDVHELLGNLSGGNQQKVVVGRELDRHPRLLVAMHPDRGLDVGATQYIQKQILAARDEGTAVVLVSTELEEILDLTDRIIVLYKGRIIGTVDTCDATAEQLGRWMAGVM